MQQSRRLCTGRDARLAILDIHRLDLIRRLDPEQSAKEVEFGFQRPHTDDDGVLQSEVWSPHL